MALNADVQGTQGATGKVLSSSEGGAHLSLERSHVNAQNAAGEAYHSELPHPFSAGATLARRHRRPLLSPGAKEVLCVARSRQLGSGHQHTDQNHFRVSTGPVHQLLSVTDGRGLCELTENKWALCVCV